MLVTVDDNLPIVEVGDEYNRSTLGADISWLNKVGGAGRGWVKKVRDCSVDNVQWVGWYWRTVFPSSLFPPLVRCSVPVT